MAFFGGTVSERPWPKVDVQFIILLLLSIAGVIGSVFLGRSALLRDQGTQSDALPQVMTVAAPKIGTMVVAASDIPAGKRLQASMFHIISGPIDGLEGRTVSAIDQIDGKFARVAIAANAPLFTESVTMAPPVNNIISQIPAGYRAVAIPVNVLTGVEGWVRPGARVDVVWSTTHQNQLMTVTIVENAQVLSAERSLDAVANEGIDSVPNHVSLLVTTNDAQKIQLAKNSGSLSLSLRGQDDIVSTGSQQLNTGALFRNRPGTLDQAIQGTVAFGGVRYVVQGDSLVVKEVYDRKVREQQATTN